MKWAWGGVGGLFNWCSYPKKHSSTLHPRFPWYEKKNKRFYKGAYEFQLFNRQEIVPAKSSFPPKYMSIFL